VDPPLQSLQKFGLRADSLNCADGQRHLLSEIDLVSARKAVERHGEATVRCKRCGQQLRITTRV